VPAALLRLLQRVTTRTLGGTLNQPAPRRSRKLTIGVLAAFVLIGLVLYLIPNPLGLMKYEEEAACRSKCETLNRSWRLVPAQPLPAAPLGKYEGLRNCECY
jgi:hypothetical protein